MSKVRIVPFFADEFLAGVSRQLSEIELGYFWIITSLIYSTGGPVEDDPARFAAMFKSGRVSNARRAIERLISLGKLQRRSGQLIQARAQKELRRAKARIAQARESGRKGGRPTRHNSSGGDRETPATPLGSGVTASRGQLSTGKEGHDFKGQSEPVGFPPANPYTLNLQTNRTSLTPIADPEVIQKMYEEWNAAARTHGLLVAHDLSPPRAHALQRVLAMVCHGDPDTWIRACRKVARSPFCRGDGQRGWRADLDWLLEPANLQRVLEGRYDEAPSRGGIHGVI